MSKRHILAAVGEVAGEAKAQAWVGLRKEALVELAEPVLTEARWLPELLRTPTAAPEASEMLPEVVPTVEVLAEQAA